MLRSYNVTALAVNLFDNTYTGVLHPLAFSIRPMDNAPKQDPARAPRDQQLPDWMASYLSGLQEAWGPMQRCAQWVTCRGR